jgi:hypothetical protein
VVNEEYGADEYQVEEYGAVDDGDDHPVDDGDDRDGNDFYDSHMYGGYRSDERGSSQGSQDFVYVGDSYFKLILLLSTF